MIWPLSILHNILTRDRQCKMVELRLACASCVTCKHFRAIGVCNRSPKPRGDVLGIKFVDADDLCHHWEDFT